MLEGRATCPEALMPCPRKRTSLGAVHEAKFRLDSAATQSSVIQLTYLGVEYLTLFYSAALRKNAG